MKRREFITLMGSAAVTWPLPLSAQQLRVPRIGILLLSGPELMGPFRESLRDLGYVVGQNIHIEVRSAEGKADRLAGLAADLVRSKVDIIVASPTPAVAAAKQATHEIPIVMAPSGDPVGTGLIASLSRPGGNITGVSGTGTELGAKSLELIKEVVPSASRVAVLSNATDPFSRPFLEHIQVSARTVRLEIQPIMVSGSDELDAAFAAMVRERAHAVVIQGSLPIQSTVDLALKNRLPALSNLRPFARAGALLAYSASFAERGREVAMYVDRILKGAKPAELPVAQPTKFELIINLRTAKTLGLTVPPTLLARADEVIE